MSFHSEAVRLAKLVVENANDCEAIEEWATQIGDLVAELDDEVVFENKEFFGEAEVPTLSDVVAEDEASLQYSV